MDELIVKTVSVLFWGAIILAGLAVYAVGWLLLQFFSWALPPVCEELGDVAVSCRDGLEAWFRDKTFGWRLERNKRRTVRDIDEISDEYVRVFRAAAQRAEERSKLTTGV